MTQYLNRRDTLAGLIALSATGLAGAALAAPLSAEDKALVDRAVAYLQGLNSAKGRFVQTDPRGSQTEGSFYLQRPGKARFAYDTPSSKLLVSDGRFVSEADTRLKTVEDRLFGLRREDDLPGSEAPAAFLSWVRDRTGPVDRVLEHNRLDVLSLVALLGQLAGRGPVA